MIYIHRACLASQDRLSIQDCIAEMHDEIYKRPTCALRNAVYTNSSLAIKIYSTFKLQAHTAV